MTARGAVTAKGEGTQERVYIVSIQTIYKRQTTFVGVSQRKGWVGMLAASHNVFTSLTVYLAGRC